MDVDFLRKTVPGASEKRVNTALLQLAGPPPPRDTLPFRRANETRRWNHSMRPFLIIRAFCLILAIAGCSKSKAPSSPAETQQEKSTSPVQEPVKANAASSKGQVDACSLLTGQEIEAIQGAAPKETKPSGNSQDGLTVSQCYFLLPTAADSIVVTLTQRADSPDARDPKQSWDEIFHGEYENAKARDEEKESLRPQNISGLGNEAFWAPQRFGGALYVLKGNSYIRISVGGAGDQANKLQKSKSLAEIVLKRL